MYHCSRLETIKANDGRDLISKSVTLKKHFAWVRSSGRWWKFACYSCCVASNALRGRAWRRGLGTRSRNVVHWKIKTQGQNLTWLRLYSWFPRFSSHFWSCGYAATHGKGEMNSRSLLTKVVAQFFITLKRKSSQLTCHTIHISTNGNVYGYICSLWGLNTLVLIWWINVNW